jgi:hypothetical protein
MGGKPFTGPGVGFGFGVGCGFGVGWGFGGMSLCWTAVPPTLSCWPCSKSCCGRACHVCGASLADQVYAVPSVSLCLQVVA